MFSTTSRYKIILSLVFAWPALAESGVAGIHNFAQVDQHLFRGAQPTKEGIEYLAKLGVKTVLDLREADEKAQAEERLVTSAGMKYVNIPMTGLKPPTEAETSQVLGILEDGSGSVFVHCKRGADRTGAVIAAYRIDHDGWDNRRALKEAMAQGMSSFQIQRQNYILSLRPKTADAATPSATDSLTAASAAVPAAAVAR
jgi:tyrosine-protein phosphatase SIW14